MIEGIIVGSLIIHLSYYVFLFSKMRNGAMSDVNADTSPISLVVCYRNESKDLGKTLPFIIDQQVDEWILIDDHSEDETYHLLKEFEKENVKVISKQYDSKGKKGALSVGVNSSTRDRILLTDADCIPASDKWSQRMNMVSKSFVLGYGPMIKTKGLVNEFSRYETYLAALQYFSYAIWGKPYMGVGRNLLISKSELKRGKDKIRGKQLASGDDDLMINALATKENCGICLDQEAFVYSPSKTTWRTFLNQKVRHLSTSFYYKNLHKFLLGVFSGTQILFYSFLFIGLVLGNVSVLSGVVFLVIKWSIQMIVHRKAMKILKEQDMMYNSIYLDVMMYLYYVTLPIYFGLNKNRITWK